MTNDQKLQRLEEILKKFFEDDDSSKIYEGLCERGQQLWREAQKLVDATMRVGSIKLEVTIYDAELSAGLDPQDPESYVLTIKDRNGRELKTKETPDSVEIY